MMKNQTKAQRVELTKNILVTLGVIGAISVVMVLPGMAKVLPLFSPTNISKVNQAIKRLHKRGLVEIIKQRNGVEIIKLTEAGKEKLARYNIDQLEIEKPLKWDGKWRVIIFDIPTSKNYSRDCLRRKMKKLGFFKLQNSVFVHPYPCYEIVKFLRTYFGVSVEVEYLEVNKLESQNKLISYFFT